MSNEDRWKTSIEGAGDGVWDWDVKNGKVVHSWQWRSMLGYSETEIGNTLAEWNSLAHPDDIEERCAGLDGVLYKKTDVYVGECRLRCKDGRYKWVLNRGVIADRAPDGTPLRVIGTFADIDQVKTVDEQLKIRERQLQDILSFSPEGVLVFSLTNQLTFYNLRLLNLFGIELASEEKLTTMTFMERVGAKLDLSDASGLFKGFGGDVEGTLRLVSPVRIIKWEVHQLDDPVLRHIMFFRDVTRETEVDRLKSEFLATAAHELRTPLSSIYGFVELLLTRDFGDKERREFMGIIHEQTKGLIQMLGELLDLARIEARIGRDFNLHEQPLQTVVNRVVADFNIPGDSRKIRLDMPKGLLVASVDADKLGQALINVLSNAHKYSAGKTGVAIDFVVRQDVPGNWVGIRVRDCGMGMTPDQLGRIFERFYRADTTGKIPGTGLGMSLVKEIMQIHGGRVEVTSEFGKGTDVTLWLPEAKSADA
ncbi:MAG: ATP-binding protein [Gallionella sp.]|jgi:PAS domain S-box-containing protein